MSTVLHIFRKDVWHTRWLLAGWLALLAVQLRSSFAAKQTTLADTDLLTLFVNGLPNVPVWTVLHWFGLVVVTFNALLAERAFGTDPYWKTRPVCGSHLVAAKLAYLGVFLVLLPTTLDIGSWVGHGATWRIALLNGLVALLLQSYVVGWMASCAVFARWRPVEITVLAVLALAAPLGCGALMGWAFDGFAKWLQVRGVNMADLDGPPDFYSLGLLYFELVYLATCVGVVAIHLCVVWRCYSHQDRRRTFTSAALLLGLGSCLPFAALLCVVAYTLIVTVPIPVATRHRVTAESQQAYLTLPESKVAATILGFTLTCRRPELAVLGDAQVVAQETYHQWALLNLTNSHASSTNSSAQPRRRPWDHWAGPPFHRTSKHPETVERLSLARTNGPLSVWFPGSRVLNDLRATNVEPRISFDWEGVLQASKRSNWTHALVTLRVGQAESLGRIERREPLAAYQARPPLAALAKLGTNAPDPRFSVAWEIVDEDGWSSYLCADWEPARKVVLWHPHRRELLFPEKLFGAGERSFNIDVTALSAQFSFRSYLTVASFPYTPAGQPSKPDAPGPEWFADAEIVFIAYKYLRTPHHVVELGPLPLPPVPPATVKP